MGLSVEKLSKAKFSFAYHVCPFEIYNYKNFKKRNVNYYLDFKLGNLTKTCAHG